MILDFENPTWVRTGIAQCFHSRVKKEGAGSVGPGDFTSRPSRPGESHPKPLTDSGLEPRIAQQIALAFHIQIDKDVVRRILARHYRPAQELWWYFLVDSPGTHERQPMEHGSVPVRIGYDGDRLGPAAHGSIHAPDRWLWRPCGNDRWCHTLSDVQPCHSRATPNAEVSQFR